MTANQPKWMAFANSRSIAVSTSRSLGPTKNFSASLLVWRLDRERQQRSRGRGVRSAARGIVTG